MQDSSYRLKESIAKCAIELFKTEGYNNVSVNEICEKVPVSRSVFYTMFKGKRSVLDYVVAKPQQNDEESFRKFADAENDFERIWQLFDRFITIALDFGPQLTSTLFIMQFESPQGIREAVHALDDLFATLAKNCAKSGIIETEEPPELLSHIATDLIIHELYVWCSQNGNFSLRERARAVRRSRVPCQAAVPHDPRPARGAVRCRMENIDFRKDLLVGLFKEYCDKYDELNAKFSAVPVAKYEYCSGVKGIGRGCYSPSLIIDIVVGNVNRGRRVTHPRKGCYYRYRYLFDENGKLLVAEDYSKELGKPKPVIYFDERRKLCVARDTSRADRRIRACTLAKRVPYI